MRKGARGCHQLSTPVGRFQALVQGAVRPVLQRMAAEQVITLEEIKKHTNEEDCWLVINGAQLRLCLSVCPPPPTSCHRTQLILSNQQPEDRTGRRRDTICVGERMALICSRGLLRGPTSSLGWDIKWLVLRSSGLCLLHLCALSSDAGSM